MSHPPEVDILLIGCGYVGQRYAAAAASRGWSLSVISRPQSAAALRRDSDLSVADIISWAWQSSEPVTLPTCKLLVVAVSHATGEGPDRANEHSLGINRLLAALPQPPQILYLSTSGVYAAGQTGDWIDESSPLGAERESPRNAIAGEAAVAAAVADGRAARGWILRPSGIYGPGRVPNVGSLRAGEPLAVDPDTYLNLIHVDDLAAAMLAISAVALPDDDRSIDPSTGSGKLAIYNVSDNRPVRRREYYEYLAAQIGAPEPIYDDAPERRRGRSAGSKRVSSSRIRQDLQVDWRYESYREGLATLL